MVGGHLRPAAGEFDARGPRFGPGRVFRRVIGKKFEVGADGTRVVGGVFGVALSDGNIGSEVYGDSGAAFEMFDTIFQLLERFQPPNPQGTNLTTIVPDFPRVVLTSSSLCPHFVLTAAISAIGFLPYCGSFPQSYLPFTQ